jgi:two-component system, NarL family, sensor kinase
MASEESTSTLRSLYRASEARAARLRLLVETRNDLASSRRQGLGLALGQAANRLALFAGYGGARVVSGPVTADPPARVLELATRDVLGEGAIRLVLDDPVAWSAPRDSEDEEALVLALQLMDAALEAEAAAATQAVLMSQLKARESDLEIVLRQSMYAQEEERRRLSADLHDGPAQQVAALHRRLELLQGDLAGMIPEPQTENLLQTIELARQTVGEIRAMIGGLRPAALDDLGVVAALREQARRLEREGYVVDLLGADFPRLPEVLETLLFRVGQEALNNILKHARCCRVEIKLEHLPQSGVVRLRVTDHGGPVDVSASEGPTFGLGIMRERVAAVGGRMEAGQTATGFALCVTAPWTGA